MIAFFKKIEPFKLFIYLWILLLPWDLYNGFMATSTIIMTIWWLFKYDYKELRRIYDNKPLIFFIAFMLFTYLSLLWTNNIQYGLKSLNFYKYYWILLPVLYTAFEKNDLKTVFTVLIFSFALYAVFSSLIFFEFIKIKDSNKSDPRGILAYANVARIMAINTFFSFYFYLSEKKNKRKYIFLLISIISLFTLFCNHGRSAQLAFFVTLVIILIFYIKQILKFKNIVRAAICLLIIGAIFNYNMDRATRFKAGYNELTKVFQEHRFEGSWGVRAYMWLAAADSIKRQPIFGAGVGDTIDEFIEYGNKYPSQASSLRSYHNQHLDYLTKFGIFGYLLFLSSIISLLLQLYKQNKQFFPLGLMFFSMIFIDSFGDILLLMKPFNNIYLLVFVLLSIASERRPNLTKLPS